MLYNLCKKIFLQGFKQKYLYFIDQVLQKNYSLDSRSLSLFRVSIALILLVNFLFTRWPWFDLFYSEKGFLPVKDVINHQDFFSKTTSLNFIYSGDGFQMFLFGLAVLCFTCLLIGYRTRLALFGSWILLASFHARNGMIINSGDNLLVLILFWSLLLPLSSHFSLDKVLHNKKTKPFNEFSINTFAFIGQILMVYVFTGFLKTDVIWKNGSAVYYALMLDNFRTQWGDILLGYPRIMEYLSHITYYFFESSLPWIFIVLGWFWPVRLIIILLMISFHFFLGLFLELGLFSWICIAGWLAFLPSQFWDILAKYLPGAKKKPLTVYYDENCFFCQKAALLIQTFLILSRTLFLKAGSCAKAQAEMKKQNSWLILDENKKWRSRWQVWVLLASRSPLLFYLAPLFRRMPVIGNKLYKAVADRRAWLSKVFAWGFSRSASSAVLSRLDSAWINKSILNVLTIFFALCFLYALAWNVRTTNFDFYAKYFSTSWNGPGKFFHLHQYWAMFSPKPANKAGWIILSAELENSKKPFNKIDQGWEEEERIDLWRGGRPLTMEKPHRYNETFPGFRHRKMIENLLFKSKGKPHTKKYLQYWCRTWNSQFPSNKVKRIELIYMDVTTPPPGMKVPDPKQRSMGKVKCRQ